MDFLFVVHGLDKRKRRKVSVSMFYKITVNLAYFDDYFYHPSRSITT